MKLARLLTVVTAVLALVVLTGAVRRIRYDRAFFYSTGTGPRQTFGNDGRPWPLPGRIEAEHYDLGTADDPAYRDSTRGSEAPPSQRYRDDDVDIGVDPVLALADVGWTWQDEWLEYTVEVARSGTYSLTTRLATPWKDQWFHFELDGRPLTDPLLAPNTGCWGSDLKGGHCFQTVTVSGLELARGPHRLRFVSDTGGYTVDRFDFALEKEAAPTNR